MKYPIIHKSETREAQPDTLGQGGGVPVGINRERGEGGFWGQILFQDVTYPWRYAFVQCFRMFDSTAYGGAGGAIYGSAGDVATFAGGPGIQSNYQPIGRNTGQSFLGPLGQMSLWNVGADAPGWPFATVQDVTGAIQQIPAGTVFNWVEEINHCQSVPIGVYVWIRGGAQYVENLSDTPRDDYTFQWNAPIWAKIVGRHYASQSDTVPDAQYQWIEYQRQRNRGSPQKVVWYPATNPRLSSPATATPGYGFIHWPAREINGNVAVPAGTNIDPTQKDYGAIVQLYQQQVISYDENVTVYDQEWLFSYPVSPEYAQFELTGSGTSAGGNISFNAGVIASSNALGTGINTNNISIKNATTVQITRTGTYLITLNATVIINAAYGTPQADVGIGTWTASASMNGSVVCGSGSGAFSSATCNSHMSCTSIFEVPYGSLPGLITFPFATQIGAYCTAFRIFGSEVTIIRLDDVTNR